MHKVLILDFGSQVTQLIARRIREMNIYSEIKPFNTSLDEIKAYNPKAIIFSGSPCSVNDGNAPNIDADILQLDVPILGICYGQQLLCQMLGGQIVNDGAHEFGKAMLNINASSKLFGGVWEKGQEYQVWMSHGDKVNALPDGFKAIATSAGAPYAAIENVDLNFYGVQFHPEVYHTPDGAAIIGNFLTKIAGIKADWHMSDYKDQAIAKVREQVGDAKVICAVSGGVDSSVVATLLHQAIGDQSIGIFVDTGLLRKDEAVQVNKMFDELGVKIKTIDAKHMFLSALEGVDDPEKKRKIIGGLFIDIFEAESNKVENAKFLAQGTLYPDVIESVSVHGSAAETIKSHHNVGGLPERMNLELVEPLRELFKDEVRALGRELGIPANMINRHPFPGPGLGIRIPGAVTPDKVAILQEADAIYIKSLRDADLYDKIWQAFAVLLPVKTVGVMGDARTYDYVCGLRAVTSTDGMTADSYPFDYGFISEVGTNIINNVKGINRVVLDITSKPPGTIEWE